MFVNKLIAGVGLVLMVTFIGCGRCQDCELNNSQETICEAEFDNFDQYQDAIAQAEADGASCTSASGF